MAGRASRTAALPESRFRDQKYQQHAQAFSPSGAVALAAIFLGFTFLATLLSSFLEQKRMWRKTAVKLGLSFARGRPIEHFVSC